MEEKTATFIVLNGLDYIKKEIRYEQWSTSIEIIGVETIRYNARGVSSALEKAMKKEMTKDFRSLFQNGKPFSIQRTTYPKTYDTEKMTIIGKNCLANIHGTFLEDKILGMCIKGMISKHYMTMNKIPKEEIYSKIIDIYHKMMNNEVDIELLKSACSVVENDVYIELLYALHETFGMSSPKIDGLSPKVKIKSLLETYK